MTSKIFLIFTNASLEQVERIKKIDCDDDIVYDLVLRNTQNVKGANKYLNENLSKINHIYSEGAMIIPRYDESHLEQGLNYHWKPPTFDHRKLSQYEDIINLESNT